MKYACPHNAKFPLVEIDVSARTRDPKDSAKLIENDDHDYSRPDTR